MSRIDVGTDRYSVNFDTFEINSEKSKNHLKLENRVAQAAKGSISAYSRGELSLSGATFSNVNYGSRFFVDSPSTFPGGTLVLMDAPFSMNSTTNLITPLELVERYKKNSIGQDPITCALRFADYDAVLAIADYNYEESKGSSQYSEVLNAVLRRIILGDAPIVFLDLKEKEQFIILKLFDRLINSGKVSPKTDASSHIDTTGCLLLKFQFFDLLERLLAAGYDIDQSYGQLLKEAIRNNDEKGVKFLFEHGAKLENGFGHDELHDALQKGNVTIAKLLLENGADVHKQYEEHSLQYSLVDIADRCVAKPFRSQAIKLLESYGAVSNETERVNLLLSRFEKTSEQFSPVKYCLSNQKYRSARDLLCLIKERQELFEILGFFFENDPDILERTFTGISPFCEDEGAFLDKLLDIAFELDVTPADFNPYFQTFCKIGDGPIVPIIKRLLDFGVDPNQSGGIGIATAAWFNQQDLVDLFIEYGAKLDLQHNPLYAAMMNGNIYIAEQLLKKSADIDKDDLLLTTILLGKFEYSPFQVTTLSELAVIYQNRDLIRDLKKGVYSHNQESHLNRIAFLLENGADPNKPPKDEPFSILYSALSLPDHDNHVCEYKKSVLDLLVQYGAKLTSKDGVVKFLAEKYRIDLERV